MGSFLSWKMYAFKYKSLEVCAEISEKIYVVWLNTQFKISLKGLCPENLHHFRAIFKPHFAWKSWQITAFWRLKIPKFEANYCTVLLFRGFETVAFSLEVYKMEKKSMREYKYFKQILTSVLQSGCPWCYHWAIRQCNNWKYCFKQNSFYCNTGPARLYQFVCDTVSGGRHFPQKINEDCLPWLLFPSLFYEVQVHLQ